MEKPISANSGRSQHSWLGKKERGQTAVADIRLVKSLLGTIFRSQISKSDQQSESAKNANGKGPFVACPQGETSNGQTPSLYRREHPSQEPEVLISWFLEPTKCRRSA